MNGMELSTMSNTNQSLVSTTWLAEHLSDPTSNPRLHMASCQHHLDGGLISWRHLPGSVHFDIDHLADKSNPLPHMCRTADFAKKLVCSDRHETGSSSMIVYVWIGSLGLGGCSASLS